MKVVVQNPFTLSYFKSQGRWTSNPEDALVFSNSRTAVKFCRDENLHGVQVVLKFPDEKFDVEIPVDDQENAQIFDHASLNKTPQVRAYA